MKIFVLLLLLPFSFIAYGQQHPKSDPTAEGKPLYFLDSVNFELSQWHFDPNKISGINIVKNHYDSANRRRGAMFITSKDPKSYTFLSITDVLNKFLPLREILHKNQQGLQKPTIFILDNDFLKDTATFKIDSSYVLKVEISRASEFEYLKNTIPELTIIRIITRTKENLNKYERIRIRGTQPTAMK
jgi:hypothetical protein